MENKKDGRVESAGGYDTASDGDTKGVNMGKVNTCANCKNWVYEEINKLDKEHNDQGRRRCDSDTSALGKGRYLHGTMLACKQWEQANALGSKG